MWCFVVSEKVPGSIRIPSLFTYIPETQDAYRRFYLLL